ncbi:MAG: hypothetical protein NUW23_15175, partial [Firmicutes bacterium]|nr:hypothetical protein [Bacillota bacterium]
ALSFLYTISCAQTLSNSGTRDSNYKAAGAPQGCGGGWVWEELNLLFDSERKGRDPDYSSVIEP